MKNVHIVIFGAGAVGGYVAGHLTRAGEDVTIVDPWPEHIEHIRKNGLRVSGSQGDYTVQVPAFHICDVQKLIAKPIDIALVSTKAFDTGWVTTMLKDYLSPAGYVVPLQNGLKEDLIASVVGWGRTVGCVINTLGVHIEGPGHIARHRTPGGAKHAVFRVGEVHGLVTERAKDLARRMEAVDSAVVTTNLWGERWSKLTVNAMQMGVLGATGMTKGETVGWEKSRTVTIRAAAEGIQVGRALGYQIEPIMKVDPDVWVSAAAGDPKSIRRVEQDAFQADLSRLTPSGLNEKESMGRDTVAGRRTEIDFLNGLIASRGEEFGIPVPVNRGLASIIRRIEQREITPSREVILPLSN